MDDYQILFSKKEQKDIAQITTTQKAKLKEILQQVLANNPYMGKALKGKLSGFYSYRLNVNLTVFNKNLTKTTY